MSLTQIDKWIQPLKVFSIHVCDAKICTLALFPAPICTFALFPAPPGRGNAPPPSLPDQPHEGGVPAALCGGRRTGGGGRPPRALPPVYACRQSPCDAPVTALLLCLCLPLAPASQQRVPRRRRLLRRSRRRPPTCHALQSHQRSGGVRPFQVP
ncbi:MAG: hypothetical protein BJ554DRAFT_5421 [Olpidium bornovanus]|uniref:Uncharacterized protein n=1 Tax=Olpidium bornovanus TaxID=278681 RepID=A0A8H8DLI3_9FUNG|nr:MAG: hypothetical protein BJ554DRAFT_5421 [Olpidium bornovanus]